MAPQAGFEPATYRLTAGRSAVELLRNLIGTLDIILNVIKAVKYLDALFIPGNHAGVCCAWDVAVCVKP